MPVSAAFQGAPALCQSGDRGLGIVIAKPYNSSMRFVIFYLTDEGVLL